MESTNEKKETKYFSDDSPEKGCCGWHSRHGFGVGKIIITIIIIAAIFCLGAFAGSFRSFGRSGSYKNFGYPIMGADHNIQGQGCGMMGGFNGGSGKGSMMCCCEMSGQKSNSVSGTITKIEGTKITVNDNGNQEKVILSVSSTKILSVSGETSLSSLKAGQTISAVGTTKDNQLEASIIRAY